MILPRQVFVVKGLVFVFLKVKDFEKQIKVFECSVEQTTRFVATTTTKWEVVGYFEVFMGLIKYASVTTAKQTDLAEQIDWLVAVAMKVRFAIVEAFEFVQRVVFFVKFFESRFLLLIGLVFLVLRSFFQLLSALNSQSTIFGAKDPSLGRVIRVFKTL